MAVSRLRSWLVAPLFVKAGADMKATPRALALAKPVRRIIDTVKGQILQGRVFDPAGPHRTSDRWLPADDETVAGAAACGVRAMGGHVFERFCSSADSSAGCCWNYLTS
jgi:hypothetical protein